MSKIKQLDIHTTNLIAAGEVIERSASVVKELVENSIDANAKTINVFLVDAGVNEVRVVDDGDGMDASDAKMCVVPHATSKIYDSQDLFRIQTLGFRGEALASIVAVSNFRLISSIDGQKAIMYSLRGGVPMSEAVVAHAKGTEVIVKGLFFNTPARLQNLQSQSVELGYITDYITKTALAMPHISFTLSNNDKVLIQTYGNNNILEVVSSTLGNEVAKNMIKIFDNDGTYKIFGYISNLSVMRSRRDNIHIIVNGRPIKNTAIINAVVKGYETKLMIGKYPIGIINVSVDPSLVDVNVHPTKAEVRFSDENKLISLITRVVDHTLSSSNLIVDIKHNEENYIDDDDYIDEEETMEDDTTSDEIIENEAEQTTPIYYHQYSFNDNEENLKEDVKSSSDNSQSSSDIESNLIEEFIQQQYSLTSEEKIVDTNSPLKKERMFYIGQLFGTYILAQNEDNFYLIDQHAAAERINYEKIIAELQKDDNIGYDLLIPFNLEFTHSECLLIEENIDKIKKLGIIVEPFGNTEYIVRRIPIWIFRGREKEYIEEIITHIIQHKKTEKVEFLNNLAKSLACKKSIKGNEFHNSLEIEYLLDDLVKTKNPYTCPHGRPVIVKFSRNEVEKWFKRIV